MPDKFSRTSVNLDAGAAEEAAPHAVDPDSPFRILILGDFTGRANRRLKSGVAGRRPVAIDIDNFDDVMQQMRPALELPGASLEFHELDHFHPDHLYTQAPIFEKLREMRSRPPRAAAARAPERPVAGLLDSIVEQSAQESRQAAYEETGDLAAFIERATAPYLEQRPDRAQQDWAASVDLFAGEQMRAILHHAQFQSLEAAWRAVWMLAQQLTADGEVKIHLLDATLDEALEYSSRDSWSLIIGNYTFGQTEQDAAGLRKLGRMAAAVGASFIAEAEPPSDAVAAPHWQALRQSPEARSIGLVLPRFLMRLPYGRKTNPVESLHFEEMRGSVHTEYLWGNPAFACALLLAKGGMQRQIEGLPLHVYEEDGASVTKPCAEILLSEKDAEFLMERGFMPLASMKDQDSALLVRFQSIAEPLAALRGRWN